MLIRVLTISLFVLTLNIQSFAQTILDNGVPVYDGPESRMFLKTWLMTDPIDIEWVRNVTDSSEKIPRDRGLLSDFSFKYDFLKALGGEQNAQPSEGLKIAIADSSSEWKLQKSNSDRINFDDQFGRHEFAVVYAYAELNVQEATQMVLGIGSDDMCKIWLNGEEVYSYTNGRANNVDDDFAFVDLIEGKNTILFKVLNQQMDWGFTCRFLSKDDLSEMELFEMQFDSLPQESFNELAVIIGGVVLTTLLLLILLLFLAKSNRKF